MSTLSSMQRSITNQDYTVTFGYVVLFVLYSSLSSIYHFLPPMLAVLFMLFTRALGRNDFLYVLIISFCLVVFEANKRTNKQKRLLPSLYLVTRSFRLKSSFAKNRISNQFTWLKSGVGVTREQYLKIFSTHP